MAGQVGQLPIFLYLVEGIQLSLGYLVDAVIDRSVKGSLIFVGKQSPSICALDMKCEMFCSLLDRPHRCHWWSCLCFKLSSKSLCSVFRTASHHIASYAQKNKTSEQTSKKCWLIFLGSCLSRILDFLSILIILIEFTVMFAPSGIRKSKLEVLFQECSCLLEMK